MSDLHDLLKPWAYKILKDSNSYNEDLQRLAQQVMKFYWLHLDCPGDPGAVGLCMEAFEQWKNLREG